MADTGTVLALALAAHFVGDWIVQTDWQASHKVWDLEYLYTGDTEDAYNAERAARRHQWRESWRAMFWHVGGYGFVLVNLLNFVWPWSWQRLVFGWINLTSHAVIDRRWTVRWLMRHTGSAAFAETWGVYAVDQALHLAILCLTVALLAP